MIVACVLVVIVCSVIYGLVRLKLQNWLEDGRMDPSSSKKRAVDYNKQSGYSTLNLHPMVSLDLTEDEDEDNVTECAQENNCKHKTALRMQNPCELNDTSHYGMDTNDYGMRAKKNRKSPEASGSTEHSIFLDTTDSIESDEESDKSACEFQPKPTFQKPLFKWDTKPRQYGASGDGTIDLTDDSDTSESTRTRKVYTNKGKGKYKGKKNENDRHPTNKNKLYSIFKMEDKVPEIEEKIEEKVPELLQVQCELTMAGVRVKLPVNPYPSQKAVMAKIIQGCKKKQHALLESPTGSGKTLALLCGALAWQDHHAAELEKERQKNLYGDLPLDDSAGKDELKDDCEAEGKGGGGKSTLQIPKIYYGTRTHRQVEQVVRELGKTSYRFKRMTILSSREHTCIRLEDRNKTELCHELLDPSKPGYCEYYTENNKKMIGTFSALSRYGVNGVWDIEDLNRLGRRYSACPYFAARNLMLDAEIVFCPYNYLLDPDIRESMQLNLANQVIILDEAHNIEDTCREAASVTLREDHIMGMTYEFKDLSKSDKSNAPVYEMLMTYTKALNEFLKQVEVLEYDSKSEYACSKYWTGAEAIELFNIHKIGIVAFASVINAGQFVLMEYQRKKESMREPMLDLDKTPIMSQTAKRNLEHLLFALKMLQSVEHVHDYRVCVTESTVKDFKPAPVTENTWYSTEKKSNRARTLKLMCMNPAVTFAPLANSARSIILASGTLSPTTSFQSELGTMFPQMLNANHVIQKDQIYASYIGKGPTGTALRATYKNVNQYTFQDELGRILLDICETIPHGVLVFFSSYHMMNTQVNRWRLSGLWKKISNHKEIFTEPRFGGDLSRVMSDYRRTIIDTSTAEQGEINGALLLAVFRGKVAEGIDFSDDEARCVVTVGIPFAVANDPIIKMKMEYNRLNVPKGLLNDNEWYTVQAFRALNQALGRCIRHKNDWGAVLMIDERFQLPDYIKNLPKWIKSSLVDTVRYNLKEDLRHFVAKQGQRDMDHKLQT